MSEKGTGLRYNKGKLPLNLITPHSQRELAKVLDFGATVKGYGPGNWQKGMDWSTVIASLRRHINEFEEGADFDDESKLPHMAHAMCNAMFLLEYQNIYPEGDDRKHVYLDLPKIALDIDGVIADFQGGFREVLAKDNINWPENHWHIPYKAKPHWESVKKNKEFWLGLKPLCELPFEPVGYVTFRCIPVEWTEDWLTLHGFPPAPVISMEGLPGEESKAEAIRSLKADVFVDDNWDNFIDLNNKKILTYLLDKPYNRHYDIGHKRINSLGDLVK